MIKKYSIYFAALAAVIVFGEGYFVQLPLDSLLIRTLIAFALFFVLGNMLGVITIEALLENQVMKIDRNKSQKNTTEKSATGIPSAREPIEE